MEGETMSNETNQIKKRPVEEKRETKETYVEMRLDIDERGGELSTGIPFFEHLLSAMSYHGGFYLDIEAKGDLEVDPHHLVEDIGLVFGRVLAETVEKYGHVKRFGHAVIPMDDSLAEVTIDAGGRPYFVYRVDFPQEYCGAFSTSLIREFLLALCNSARVNIHVESRYGDNSHHIAEALFKALGKSIAQAYTLAENGEARSTKGHIEGNLT